MHLQQLILARFGFVDGVGPGHVAFELAPLFSDGAIRKAELLVLDELVLLGSLSFAVLIEPSVPSMFAVSQPAACLVKLLERSRQCQAHCPVGQDINIKKAGLLSRKVLRHIPTLARKHNASRLQTKKLIQTSEKSD